jgi:hypothetical protein
MIAATALAIGMNLFSMHTAGGMNNVNPDSMPSASQATQVAYI